MSGKVKIALVDGLPFQKEGQHIKVMPTPETGYPWDSDFFGVPEYRRHADKMLRIIMEENPEAEIVVCPFYPKFNSMRKNYSLLVKSIEKALEYKCHIICMCLEVISVAYLSSEMLGAYKSAWNQGITICVSAGNHRPFLNPLIHNKYTIPVIGLTKNNKIPTHLNDKNISKYFGAGMFGGRSYLEEQNVKKINCSMATARFAGRLSKLLAEHELRNELEGLFKGVPAEAINHNILSILNTSAVSMQALP